MVFEPLEKDTLPPLDFTGAAVADSSCTAIRCQLPFFCELSELYEPEVLPEFSARLLVWAELSVLVVLL